jgi:hypothetical protein
MRQIKLIGNEQRLSSKQQSISKNTMRCYPKVDLLASKRNRLVKTCASVRSRQHRKCFKTGLVKIKDPVLLHPPIPLLLKILRKFQKKKYLY